MRISDWSSDVCSSDLQHDEDALADLDESRPHDHQDAGEAEREGGGPAEGHPLAEEQHGENPCPEGRGELNGSHRRQRQQRDAEDPQHLAGEMDDVAKKVARQKIGRMAGGERECQYGWISVVAGNIKKKKEK